MKIAIASNGKDTSAQVDERFGRADYFLITNENCDTIQEIIENKSKNSQTGAGTGSASLIAEKGVKALFAGNLGPKAESVLSQAGISFVSFSGTVGDALEFARTSNLSASTENQTVAGKNQPMKQGPGMGQGRGMGGGKGGCGGKGGGGGRCMAGQRGMGRNQSGRF
ncbi:MAG: NifB/NifX family molybdenum-iron cluster-binding protein [Desulfobacteraceae bacterium]